MRARGHVTNGHHRMDSKGWQSGGIVRFSLVDGVRAEARPKPTGRCPCCGGLVIAKCGQFRVWHWSHKAKAECDSWAEAETEWHRSWKERFPVGWQEVVCTDASTGEKHVADVQTPDGLTIELQHSYIRQEELRTRQEFYGRLIWIGVWLFFVDRFFACS